MFRFWESFVNYWVLGPYETHSPFILSHRHVGCVVDSLYRKLNYIKLRKQSHTWWFRLHTLLSTFSKRTPISSHKGLFRVLYFEETK